MFTYVQLDRVSLAPFTDFIPQNILDQIDAFGPEMTAFAYGVFEQKTPVGICIASIDSLLRFVEVLHIEVKLEFRNRHIGRTLLRLTQDEAKKHQMLFSSLIFEKDTPNSPPIEKILQANNWKGPRPFLTRALFDTVAFNAPLLNLKLSFPDGFKEFLWKNLTKKQQQDLIYREREGHFSKSISPFTEENSIEKANSLGLEKEGRVIGWMITHRVNAETVRYSALYIEPTYQTKGIAIKLLTDSMRLHKQHPTRWALIEISSLQSHPAWIDFIKKRILPSAIKVSYLVQAWT